MVSVDDTALAVTDGGGDGMPVIYLNGQFATHRYRRKTNGIRSGRSARYWSMALSLTGPTEIAPAPPTPGPLTGPTEIAPPPTQAPPITGPTDLAPPPKP